MSFRWTGWKTDPAAKDDLSPYIDWLKLVSFDGEDEKDGLPELHGAVKDAEEYDVKVQDIEEALRQIKEQAA